MTVNWRRYHAAIQIDERIVGGIPIVPEGADRADAYEDWARGQGVEDGARPLAEALAGEEDMPTAEEVAGLSTGFRRDEHDGLYVEARQVKANLREAAQRLGIVKQVRGARQVLQHDLHVRAPDGSQKLYLGRAEPDGTDQRPISVVTRQGPRTSIKRFEYVTRPQLRFEIRVLAGGVGEGLIDTERLRDMLEFGGTLGLGADRSQGEGTFTLVELEEVDPP